MNSQDKELIENKIAGVHAAIVANQDIQIVRDEKLIILIQEVRGLAKEARDLGLKTNGRVTELEKKEINHFNICPNVSTLEKIQKNFFIWFDTPVKIALFFALIIFVTSIFDNPLLWGYVERLFKLL